MVPRKLVDNDDECKYIKLKINEDYAKRYKYRKEKEELNECKFYFFLLISV